VHDTEHEGPSLGVGQRGHSRHERRLQARCVRSLVDLLELAFRADGHSEALPCPRFHALSLVVPAQEVSRDAVQPWGGGPVRLVPEALQAQRNLGEGLGGQLTRDSAGSTGAEPRMDRRDMPAVELGKGVGIVPRVADQLCVCLHGFICSCAGAAFAFHAPANDH